MTTRIRANTSPCGTHRCGARPARPAANCAHCAGCAATPCSCSSPPPRSSPCTVGRGGGRLRRRRAVVLLLVWWRAHPASFDRWAAPRIRSAWRRWTVYRGRRWAGLLDECELTRDHRRTGADPRPAGPARAVGDSVDRHPRGADGPRPGPADLDRPHPRTRRCAARRTRRRLPPSARGAHGHRGTAQPVPARPRRHPHPRHRRRSRPRSSMSGTTNTAAHSCSTCAASGYSWSARPGAGKSSLLWNPLRAAGPMIRDGLLRVWMIDLKGGTETDRGQALFHRWATTLDDAIDLLTEFRDSMLQRQAWMRRPRCGAARSAQRRRTSC